MEDTGKDERKKMRPIAGNTSKEISQYYRSKNEECNVVKHYPDWDAVRGEPILDLMRVGREMLSVDAELEAKRLEYDNRRQLFDQQWKDLRRKEIALKKSFVKFDEFVRENREKRERADRKIREEKERQKIRESEICDLEIKLKQLEKVRDRMKSFVEEYKPFQAYLEELLNSNEFQSIAEIFNRYETLMAARISLNINQDKTLESLELTNLQLQKLTEKRAQHLLDLNSRLAKAQARYELAHAESLKWELAVAENKDIVTQQELENTQIRDCVWNLYNQMCYRKGVSAEAKREDLEEQLQMVKRTIVELGKIVKMAQRRARRELRAIQKSEYQKKVKKVIRARSYMSRMSALSTVSRSRTKSVRSIASTWDTRSMISTF